MRFRIVDQNGLRGDMQKDLMRPENLEITDLPTAEAEEGLWEQGMEADL